MSLTATALKLVPSRRLLLIIWPFLAIVALLVALATESLTILSAGRAYVEGESLWSKAQKQSLVHLMRYAHTHAESDYRAFRDALTVPLGDRKARLELEKPDPDYAVAYRGFREGRNHPDDIPGMIMLFRRFRNVSYIDRSITLWADGDRSIDEFVAVAEELHQQISAGETNPDKLYAVVERIFTVDARLTPEEDTFSSSLGEGMRKTRLLLSIATLALAGTLIPLGILFSRRMLERNEAFEQALKTSERRFDLAVAGSNDGIWDWDLVTDRVYYSPRFNELLGYTHGGLEGTPAAFLSRLHPDDVEATVAPLRLHLQSGTAFDVECRLQTQSAEYRWFHVRGRSVRDPSGRTVRMAGSLTHITERVLAREELRRHRDNLQQLVDERTRDLVAAKEAAEAANLAKSQFLANMSHELRTPMHAILSFARLGLKKIVHADVQRPKLEQYFARIDQSGERLLRLLNDLLDLSKLEAGKMLYRMEPVDLGIIIRSALAQFDSLALDKGLTLKAACPETPMIAWCDAERVSQVLFNLLSNAIKFSPADSSVTVAASDDHFGSAEEGICAVRVSVSDQGIGIPEAELRGVFDKFVQSSKTTSSSGGTGLGLSICREIIEHHDGRIWAQNIKGGGARLTFLLPREAMLELSDEMPHKIGDRAVSAASEN